VGPARHQARVDEGAHLDVLEAGLRQRLDQPDLVGRADRPGLDLETLARTFLVDINMCRQVGHFCFPLICGSRSTPAGFLNRWSIERGAMRQLATPAVGDAKPAGGPAPE